MRQGDLTLRQGLFNHFKHKEKTILEFNKFDHDQLERFKDLALSLFTCICIVGATVLFQSIWAWLNPPDPYAFMKPEFKQIALTLHEAKDNPIRYNLLRQTLGAKYSFIDTNPQEIK
jgi:hypothetical protein